MALSLGWHIVIACFGVGFPLLVLVAEWRGQRTGDETYELLARRWAKALAVLFAIGAVSGTILSFEFGILWPGLMGRFGAVFGFPFALEAIAFFLEAIFLGIYLYGWDRLSPRAHLLSAVPIVVSGAASAWFVVTANAWMNQPRGFTLLADGTLTDPRPLAAIANAATPVQTTHMLLAAYMVTGFGVAAVYAGAMLRGRRDRYHRLGFVLSFSLGAALALPQVVVGDWAARFVAHRQPVKFAALEGIRRTTSGADLRIGGLTRADGSTIGALTIPNGASLLAFHDPHHEVVGLDSVPPADRPPVPIVRTAFQLMVLVGTALVALSGWYGLVWWRRRRLPRARLFLLAALAAGPAAVLALECGWIVTEVGRQPWVVYRILRTADAVTHAPNIRFGYYALIAVYAVLTVATVFILRRLAAMPRPGHPEDEAPPAEPVPMAP
ncbi:MAG: cytochrome ubiquinol oxidase subunit I [Frankia sp.]|nr:cytochrome ubiquinol oxidase subunit I [Frankia sp.]